MKLVGYPQLHYDFASGCGNCEMFKPTGVSFRTWFYIGCMCMQVSSLFANSYIVHEDTTVLFFVQSFIVFHACCTVVDMLRAHKLHEVGKRTIALFKTEETILTKASPMADFMR